ncbi:MAG: DUF4369 domain-containing protein [Bacteroidales bacterium]|nr:DUF4369 domain-containing protein [Bacteroidales bacterium]
MKIHLSFVLILILLCGCKNNNDNYEILIKCNDCNNLNISLWQLVDTTLYPIGLTKIEHNKAIFKGDVVHPTLMFIYTQDCSDYFPIFVENSEIDIEFNYLRPSKSVVRGSQSHKIFNDFLQSYSAYEDKSMAIEKMIKNAKDNFDTLMVLSLENDKNKLEIEKTEFQKQYIKNNVTSSVSAYILSNNLMYNISLDDLQYMLNLFPKEFENNIYIKNAQNYLNYLKNNAKYES